MHSSDEIDNTKQVFDMFRQLQTFSFIKILNLSPWHTPAHFHKRKHLLHRQTLWIVPLPASMSLLSHSGHLYR